MSPHWIGRSRQTPWRHPFFWSLDSAAKLHNGYDTGKVTGFSSQKWYISHNLWGESTATAARCHFQSIFLCLVGWTLVRNAQNIFKNYFGKCNNEKSFGCGQHWTLQVVYGIKMYKIHVYYYIVITDIDKHVVCSLQKGKWMQMVRSHQQ